MSQKYGIEGKLFYCAAGIGGTPTWIEAAHLKNVSAAIDGKEVDLTTRANGGFEATGVALLSAAIEADMPHDPTDADYIALETAFFAKSTIGVAVMSGAIAAAGSRGLWADCLVTKFQREESADGAQEIKLTLKPTRSANPPSWHIIASSTAPAVTGVSPNGGAAAGGAFVTITGSGFSGATAVHFGVTAAASFVVSSDSIIVAAAPAHAAGAIDVTVTTPGGTSPTGGSDTYTYA